MFFSLNDVIYICINQDCFSSSHWKPNTQRPILHTKEAKQQSRDAALSLARGLCAELHLVGCDGATGVSKASRKKKEDSTKVYQLPGWFPSFFSVCFHLLVEEDGHTVFGFLCLQSVTEKRTGAEQTSTNYSPDTFLFSTSCGQSRY